MARLCGLVATGLLTSALLAPQAWGQDCSVPVELPDKPRIQDFADYNDFVVDVMKYKKKKRQQAQHKKQCPQAYVVRKRPSPDPRVIEGPETLGEALRRTERLPQVDYAVNQTWYNKSTSRSFGLPSLSGEELSQRSVINAHLQSLSSSADGTALSQLSPRERRRLSYEALAARQEGDTGGKQPLPGADVLPLFYASEFRARSDDPTDASSERLYYLLALREQETNEALEPESRFSSLNYLASTSTVRNQRLNVFVGDDGNTLRYGTVIQVEDCLSSCLPH